MARQIIVRRTRRSPGRSLFLTVVLACLILWVVGLFMFAETIPRKPTTISGRTDAIVVLTGGSQRLETGLELLANNRGKRLFVSGVHRGVDVTGLLRAYEQAPDRTRCCLDIGHDAANTDGNARETAEWMRKNAFESLRLVTASYHMPRALLEFRDAMPDDQVIPHPVFPPHVRIDEWWRWPGTAALVVGEYNKFLVAWARIATRSAWEAAKFW